jgi:hypothetical protein
MICVAHLEIDQLMQQPCEVVEEDIEAGEGKSSLDFFLYSRQGH